MCPGTFPLCLVCGGRSAEVSTVSVVCNYELVRPKLRAGVCVAVSVTLQGCIPGRRTLSTTSNTPPPPQHGRQRSKGLKSPKLQGFKVFLTLQSSVISRINSSTLPPPTLLRHKINARLKINNLRSRMRDEQSQVFFFYILFFFTACARARFNRLSVSSAKHHFCFSSTVTDQMCEHTRTFRDINAPRLQGRAHV